MNELWQRLFKRRQYYRRLFLDGDGKLNPSAEIVLADLKRFCRVETSTVGVSPFTKTIDPLAMAMAEGRREVWNRIPRHLQMADRDIARLTEDSRRGNAYRGNSHGENL